MSHIHFQYAVEIRRVLKQAHTGITRADLYDRVHVDDKSEQRFGETLAELCQGRNPDVVIAIVDGEPSTYSLSLDALAFSRRQELPSTHVIPRPQPKRLTPTPPPKPRPPPSRMPTTPVITRNARAGTRWKHVLKKKPGDGRMPWEPKTTTHVCCDCGDDVVHTGRGRKPKRCQPCREKHNPTRQHCPTCGRRMPKPKTEEMPT